MSKRKESEEKIKRQIEHLAALRDIDQIVASNFDLRISLTTILSRLRQNWVWMLPMCSC